MIIIDCSPSEVIVLGRQGETGARQLRFNLREWMGYYPQVFSDSNAKIILEFHCYGQTETLEFTNLSTTISDYSLIVNVTHDFTFYDGRGYLRLKLMLNDLIAVSDVYETCCLRSQGENQWEWAKIFNSIKDGTYRDKFAIGDILPLKFGPAGALNAQIVGFDEDEKADGTGTAHITFISQFVGDVHRMNPALTPDSPPYNEGTGGVGGWEKCEMRQYLINSILPQIMNIVKTHILPVKKYSNSYDINGIRDRNLETVDSLWIPSAYEIAGFSPSYESGGPRYSDRYFTDNTKRRKTTPSGTIAAYWLRTVLTSNSKPNRFKYIASSGNISAYSSIAQYRICIGFCM